MPKKYLSLLIGAIFLILVGIFCFKSVLIVKNIEINSAAPCTTEGQIADILNVKNTSLFQIPKNDLEKSLSSKISCIESAKINLSLPSTLKVSYNAKIPVAKIDSTEYQLTADGLVIQTQNGQYIPTIFLSGLPSLQPGQKITDKNILSALKISQALLKSDFAPTNIRFVEGSITVYNQQDAVAIFSTEKPADVQTDALQQVLAKAKIDSKKISKIDMRFDNPIVVFK